MLNKSFEVIKHWHEQFADSFLFALVGLGIGIGQLLDAMFISAKTL